MVHIVMHDEYEVQAVSVRDEKDNYEPGSLAGTR